MVVKQDLPLLRYRLVLRYRLAVGAACGPQRVAALWRSGLLDLRSGGPDGLSDIIAHLGRGATGRIEGCGAGIAVASSHRLIQLEMEGGPTVGAALLRVGAEPE